mgnify:CR=1 FL=1|jgi:hypothetical protein
MKDLGEVDNRQTEYSKKVDTPCLFEDKYFDKALILFRATIYNISFLSLYRGRILNFLNNTKL